MAKFTAADLREAMDNKKNIRNMSVIAHLSHGKSTLVDSLVTAAGVDREGVPVDVPMTHTRADEAKRGISIKSTGISLLYDMDNESLQAYKGDRDGNKYLINLIDSPGHADFSSEVTAALRVTDGALLVIDCVEGVCLQTETVLRQALSEDVKPILCLSKVDKLFHGLRDDGVKRELKGEEAYQILSNVIENANDIMAASYEGTHLGDVQFSPEKGNVAFSAGLDGWAFTIPGLAKLIAPKLGVDESDMVEKLWGENFYDHSTRKWTSEDTGSKNRQRGFVQLCYAPIKQIIDVCMKNDKDYLWNMLPKIGVRISSDEKELSGLALLRCVMQAWLPTSTALLEMAVSHLPSPCEAQQYRVEKLYEGPVDDSYARAIRNCDPDGPLMLYVSKMIRSSEAGRFSAFGRVFSGRVATGMKVRIMGPSYLPGTENDLYMKPAVQNTRIWMGRNHYDVEEIPCGSTVIMTGLEEYITKSATLTNEGEVGAWPIRPMKFSVSPVVYVTVECKVLKDVPELEEGLKRLAKSDLIVLCSKVNNRRCTVAGAGELHLQICLNDLRDGFMDGSKIDTCSRPEVSLREAILAESGTMETKSPNGKNSLFMAARPMDEKLVQAIEDGILGPRTTDLTVRSKILSEFGLNENLAEKICCFTAGSNYGPSMVIAMCKGVSDPDKEILAGCFQEALQEGGALVEKALHGICFEVHRVVLHAETRYRNLKNQLTPMVKKAFHNCQLKATPRLLEPVFTVEIHAPMSEMHTIYGLLNQKFAHVFQTFERQDTQLTNLRAYLHGNLLVGFAEAFRAATCGKVTPQCVFTYWNTMSSDPLKASSLSGQMVADIREAKKMKDLSVVLKELKL